MATDPDPDDLIFPRTTTRVSTKYQALIPVKDGSRDPGENILPYSLSSSQSYEPTTQLQISRNVVGRRP
jgi:hypothetical protein